MTRGQVTKHLRDKEDGVYIAVSTYGEVLYVSDKLYAHQGVAQKMRPGSRIVKVTKEMLEYLDREQNGVKEA